MKYVMFDLPGLDMIRKSETAWILSFFSFYD